MDIKSNTQQINTFAGGMNTDLSDMLLKSSQYRLAKNVRYVTNDEENGGELRMVDGCVFGGDVSDGFIIDDKYKNRLKVLYTGAIRNYAIAIVKVEVNDGERINVIDPHNTSKELTNSHWWVLVSKNPFENVDNDSYIQMDKFKVAFGPCGATLGNKLSVVCRYENYNNVHVYIADGINPVLSINIGHAFDDGFVPSSDYNAITSNPQVTFKRIQFVDLVDGALPAGMVEYSYQYFNKYGNESKISVPTKLIPIVKGSGNYTEGYRSGETSNRGVELRFPGKHESFDSMRIYRIQYIENGQAPTVDVIYESNVNTTDFWTYIDGGQPPLYNVTLEEYNANSGIHIIPKVIESKEDRLFAANIKKDLNSFVSQDILNWDARAYRFPKDSTTTTLYTYGTTSNPITVDNTYQVPEKHDCWQSTNNINKDLTEDDPQYQYNSSVVGGSGINISWSFNDIKTSADANTSDSDYYSIPGTNGKPLSLQDDRSLYVLNYTKFDDGNHLMGTDIKASLANSKTSYTYPSLKADELYRYGIVLYDKYGNASPVKWIADIRTPIELPIYTNEFSDLTTSQRGLFFDVNEQSLIDVGVTSYEIVRCIRSEKDIKNLSVGVLSRPIKRLTNKYNLAYSQATESYPYTPSGWLTTADYWAGSNRLFDFLDQDNTQERSWWAESNCAIRHVDHDDNNTTYTTYSEPNKSIFQFVSPEVCYAQDSFKQLLQGQSIKIKPLTYLYGYRSRKTKNDFDFDSTKIILPEPPDATSIMSYGLFLDQVLYPGNEYTRMYVENTAVMYRLMPDTGSSGQGGYKVNYIPLHENATGNQNQLDIITNCSSVSTMFYYGDKKLSDCVQGNAIKDITINYKQYSIYREATGYEKNGVGFNQLDTNKRYSYIKLYIASDNIVVSKFAGGCREIINNTSVSSIGSAEVEDFAFADTMQWDDFAEIKKSGETYSLKYTNTSTAIGNNSFVNWVSNGAYNVPATGDWSTLKLDQADLQDDMLLQTNVVMGPGGACMLLNIKDADVALWNSAAVPNEAFKDTKSYMYKHTTLNGLPIGGGEKIYVVPESRLGTFLCSIQHTITPYSGFSYENRKQDMYYSFGDVFVPTEVGASQTHLNLPEGWYRRPVFNGDCYRQAMEYVSQHKYYFAPNKYTKNACIVYSFPTESSINLAFTDGFEFHKNNAPTEIQEKPADVYKKFVQTKSLYRYNPVYSAHSTAHPKAMQLDRSDYDIEFDTRCFYSNVKSNNENTDNWLRFMPANFIDVDSRKGPITNLRTFNNQLFFWQTDGTGILSVNERAAVSDQSGLPLMLGTGGVLDRFDYLNTACGMKENEFADAQSDSVLYWWDHTRKELCAHAAGNGLGVNSLSKEKGVQNLINVKAKQNLLASDPTLIYDKKYNELIAYIATTAEDDTTKDGTPSEKITATDDGSMIYSELTGQFVSLVDVYPKHAIQFGDKIYMMSDKDANDKYLWLWNYQECKKNPDVSYVRGFSNMLYPYVKYVINDNNTFPKVFDNITFGGRFYGGDKEDITPLHFKFKTPLKQQGEADGTSVENREYDFRMAIPRHKNSQYGDRLRGKTMQCEMWSLKSDVDFSLQYITTKYRISWV